MLQLRLLISSHRMEEVPYLCDPDLILQLSQHLFSVQMAVYRNNYPQNLFHGDSTYRPPPLPVHIPIALEPVVGSPSNEQLQAARNAIRVSESLAGSPLFDSNLNMKLSQHLFNLQFARYSRDSTLGLFSSNLEAFDPAPPTVQRSQANLSTSQNATNSATEGIYAIPPGPIQNDASDARAPRPSSAELANLCCTSSSVTQLGESVNTIKELMNESKGVLENINRMLMAIQRGQAIVGKWEDDNLTHTNPVNQQGALATSIHTIATAAPKNRSVYPLGVFPGDNTYAPPSLPDHIPIKLEPVVGFPSNQQLITVQNAMRIVESREELDLNMQLSQHFFDLQFARYIQGSSLGQSGPQPEEPLRAPPTAQGLRVDSSASRDTNNCWMSNTLHKIVS
ncbi:unnamed protein product, partial [Rhizoctonia solani]